MILLAFALLCQAPPVLAIGDEIVLDCKETWVAVDPFAFPAMLKAMESKDHDSLVKMAVRDEILLIKNRPRGLVIGLETDGYQIEFGPVVAIGRRKDCRPLIDPRFQTEVAPMLAFSAARTLEQAKEYREAIRAYQSVISGWPNSEQACLAESRIRKIGSKERKP